MRRIRHRLTSASDEQLIDRARGGDRQAFGELYQRHRRAAESTAQWMLRSRSDVDDVVADAFAGVLEAMRNGHGPRDNFRSYLLAAVRNGCRSRWQRINTAAAHDLRGDTDSSPVYEDPERYVEADTVARAFASLSPRWQQTLWLTEVEQRSSAEVAAHLQLAPNATAALTHRAREAFATAYLAEHIDAAPHDTCERYAPRLASYVRDQLTDSQRTDVERHLIDCPSCQQAVSELRDVNASLRKLLPPAVSVLAAPSTVGITTLGTMSGLFSSGLLLKGATAVLVATPLLFNVTGGSRGGDTMDHDEVRTVVAAPRDVDADDDPIVAAPRSLLANRSPRIGSPGTTTTIVPAPVVEPVRPGPTLGAEPSRAPTLPIDDVTSPVTDVVLDPVIDDLVDPVVDGLVVPVVEDVVLPVVDPVIDDVVVPVVEDVVLPVVDPVIDEVVVPVVEDVVAPVVDPVIDDVVVPVVEDVVVPVVDPVIDDVVVPVVEDVVAPVVDPVVDDVVVPVVEDVVLPVVDPVIDDVVVPVVEDVVVPVVDVTMVSCRWSRMWWCRWSIRWSRMWWLPVVDPVIDDVVVPVVEDVVLPVVDPVIDDVVVPVVEDVVVPVVDPVIDDVVVPVVEDVVVPVVDPVDR